MFVYKLFLSLLKLYLKAVGILLLCIYRRLISLETARTIGHPCTFFTTKFKTLLSTVINI
jgi:hypothetical protein